MTTFPDEKSSSQGSSNKTENRIDLPGRGCGPNFENVFRQNSSAISLEWKRERKRKKKKQC